MWHPFCGQRFWSQSIGAGILSAALATVGCGDLDQALIEKKTEPRAAPATALPRGVAAEGDLIAELEERRRQEVERKFNFAPTVIGISAFSVFDADLKLEQIEALKASRDLRPGTLEPFMDWGADKAAEQTLSVEMEKAITRPWKGANSPLVDQWLSTIEADLRRVTNEPRNSSCVYFPFMRNGLLIDGFFLQDVVALSALNEGLLAQGQKIAAQDPDKAKVYFLVALELAALQTEEPLAVKYLVAGRSFEKCCRGLGNFVVDSSLSQATIRELQGKVKNIAEFDKMVEKLDLGDRYRIKVAAKALQDKVLNDSSYLDEIGFPKELLALQTGNDELWPDVQSDIDQLLNRLTTALKIDDPSAIKKRASEFIAQLKSSQRFSDEHDVKPEVRKISSQLILALLADIHKLQDSETRLKASRQMLQTTLLLAAYRAENGSFPDRLDKLSFAGVSSAMYQDPFGSGPLQYQLDGERITLYSVGPDGENDQASPNSDDFCLIRG